ncbi:MAG: MarR family transcriptional regulator, partial [Planctomycetota bacterium]
MKSSFKMLEREVSLNLARSYAFITGPFDELFGQHGITPIQYNVLRILRGHGTPVSVGQIRDELVTGHPDVPRLVDRL